MSKITESARGECCRLLLEGVCLGKHGVVWAHLPRAIHVGAGRGLKPDDVFGAYLCSACHSEVDSPRHFPQDYLDLEFYRAMAISQRALLDKGIITHG